MSDRRALTWAGDEAHAPLFTGSPRSLGYGDDGSVLASAELDDLPDEFWALSARIGPYIGNGNALDAGLAVLAMHDPEFLAALDDLDDAAAAQADAHRARLGEHGSLFDFLATSAELDDARDTALRAAVDRLDEAVRAMLRGLAAIAERRLDEATRTRDALLSMYARSHHFASASSTFERRPTSWRRRPLVARLPLRHRLGRLLARAVARRSRDSVVVLALRPGAMTLPN